MQKHMEAQVVRLSEAFNRQVEERDDLQSHLEAAEMKALTSTLPQPQP